jgi:hypothetical protein
MAHDDHNFPPEPVPRRRSPAGQAMLVMVMSLLVACLLNADRLDHTAHTQPFGWQRTVALDLTGPLKELARVTYLNRPRHWLSHSAGNDDPPPAIDTKDVVIAGEKPASATTTTTTIPPPIRRPTPSAPLRILVSGDSLMGWIGPAMDKSLSDEPVQITEDWKIATGLARPDVTNWPVQLNADMCSYDPEVVVLGFGGNDDQDMQTDDGVVHVGTKEWAKEYQRRVVQVLDDVNPSDPTKAGACPGKRPRTVYWIGLPIVTKAHLASAEPAMAKAVKAEIAIRPWAHYIDTRPLLSPDGTYTAYLPDEHGTLVKVRENDGVHPNLAGAERIVVPVVNDVRKERKL